MWSPAFRVLSPSRIRTCSESYTQGWEREPDWQTEPVQSSGSLSQPSSTSKPWARFPFTVCSFISKVTTPRGLPLSSPPGPVHSQSWNQQMWSLDHWDWDPCDWIVREPWCCSFLRPALLTPALPSTVTLSMVIGECLPFYIIHTICSLFCTAGISVRQWGCGAKQARPEAQAKEPQPCPAIGLNIERAVVPYYMHENQTLPWTACTLYQCLDLHCVMCYWIVGPQLGCRCSHYPATKSRRAPSGWKVCAFADKNCRDAQYLTFGPRSLRLS